MSVDVRLLDPLTSSRSRAVRQYSARSIEYDGSITAFAARTGLAEITVWFSQRLRSIVATTATENYVLTGPSSLTVDSVSFTPGDDYVQLAVSGVWVTGEYTVSMPAHTVESLLTVWSPALAPTVQCIERTSAANPLVTIISPPVHTVLGAGGEITLTVTDLDGFTRIILLALFSTISRSEPIWDGAFFAPYTGTATPITNGWQLVIRRYPTWPTYSDGSGKNWYLPPSLKVYAIDQLGKENP